VRSLVIWDHAESQKLGKQYNTIQKFVTRTMSVSLQNRRRGQSLVANGKSKDKNTKRLQQNKMF